ncbi:MAG: ABC transporter permease [Candidatus Woesearchaeota archaeon]
MISEYFSMAIDNLKRRRLRSWLTLLGIFIGIATIVLLIALGDGLQDAVMSQFDSLAPEVIVANARASYGQTSEPFDLRDVRAVERVNGVESVSPRMQTSVNINFQGTAKPVNVFSVPGGDYRDDFFRIFPITMDRGRVFSKSDRAGVIIGSNVATSSEYRRDMRLGDRVTIRGRDLEVVAIADSMGNFMADNSIMLPENLYLDILSSDDVAEYDDIGAKATNEEIVDEVAEEIEIALRQTRDVDEIDQNFGVETAEDIADQVGAALFAVRLFFYVIAGISIFVGGIGIANTMYTAVLERTKEIGIMKAIGAKNSSIFLLFFIESGFLGMVGGIIGAAIGFILGQGIDKYVDLLEPQFSVSLVIGSVLFAFIMGSISGLVPAYQASRLNPVDALNQNK